MDGFAIVRFVNAGASEVTFKQHFQQRGIEHLCPWMRSQFTFQVPGGYEVLVVA